MHQRRYHNYLKHYRKQRGLTQRDVALILGLKSSSMISRWEHGVLLPETMNALKMAVLYQTEVDTIFGEVRRALLDELAQRAKRVRLAGRQIEFE
jgi:transcriptional regulator with XRE-family HTH domain